MSTAIELKKQSSLGHASVQAHCRDTHSIVFREYQQAVPPGLDKHRHAQSRPQSILADQNPTPQRRVREGV